MNTDECHAELHAAGWSTGDTAAKEGDSLDWMVYCHKGDSRFIARGPSRGQAWTAAVKIARESEVQ